MGHRKLEMRHNYLTGQLHGAAERETARNYAEAALREAERELCAMHREYHPACLNLGPNSCPTWHAIYAVRAAMSRMGCMDIPQRNIHAEEVARA